jgi:hypothetical protein
MHYLYLAGALFLSTFLFTTTAWADEPRSYPIACRGGGDFDIGLTGYSTATETGTQLTFRYKVSGGPATAGLEPGECAWMDRGINDIGEKILRFRFRSALFLMTVRRTGERVVPILTTGGSGRDLQELYYKMTGAEEFQAHAYYDSEEGILIATKYRP